MKDWQWEVVIFVVPLLACLAFTCVLLPPTVSWVSSEYTTPYPWDLIWVALIIGGAAGIVSWVVVKLTR